MLVSHSRRRTHNLRNRLFSISFGVAVIYLLFTVLGSNENKFDEGSNKRHLMSDDDYEEGECDSSFDQNGGIALYFFGVLYMFAGLAVICDEYFTASLESISEALHLSEDVAGATFMAAGSSAPELFTSIMSVFVAENDTGIGAIVGSAIFNILIIIGVIAICSGQVVQLDWRPLLRDSCYYAVSILVLLIVFQDEEVSWVEAVIMVILYLGYVILMYFNSRIMALCEPKDKAADEMIDLETPVERQNSQLQQPNSDGDENAQCLEAEEEKAQPEVRPRRLSSVTKNPLQVPHKVHHEEEHEAEVSPDNITVKIEESKAEEEEPKSTFDKIWAVVMWPLLFLFKYTVPNCQEEKWKKWYMASFIISILWIGVLSFFMVEWATAIGCILDIPPIVMGLTVLAAGTSVPDALSSVMVARDGMGDMAVANGLGSNVFDILLGLGLPWTIYTVFIHNGDVVTVKSDGVVSAVAILFGILFLVLISIMIPKWRLFKQSGYWFLFVYCIYVTYVMIDTFA
eukprot:GCRY01000520.1.p1 GENE.GCRY01000520.1~~GCRY01000520.1.p1  ORF type:complete len:514 (+),score=95.62 GCRY01000520.1:218-1759(+)